MSFFRKDYSAYPQPVVVTPDPRYAGGSISEAVAEAIDTEHTSKYRNNTVDNHQTESIRAPRSSGGTGDDAEQDNSSEQQLPPRQLQQENTQHESSSQVTTTQELQQKDSAKLADGIMSLLGPIVQEMDFNIVSVRKSQSELEKEIERLMAGMYRELPIYELLSTELLVDGSLTFLFTFDASAVELQLFMASSAAPPDVEPAVQKLLKARRQIMTANSTLKTVQDRVDRMHLQIARRQ
ncbi:hypothetical protein BGZ80_002355 [Entomortierella chlamydospora]|uniref:Uncharacterized protein n=1 Tax=Entomortierella chlamydospora TaxID=101097 RepID=A0A9P6MQ83_9FUNG|nr:hypothetical protein BGZ79_000326 [Entomortierella chlamydospora]KAG0009473.1 hypothetical protein BGZ80_002355 [Entomortierella chlamydospora]